MSDDIKKDEAPKGDGDDLNSSSAKTAAGNTGQDGAEDAVRVGDPTDKDK